MFQIKVWKLQEYFVYFKIFKPTSWGKRPAERRSRFFQRFLNFSSETCRWDIVFARRGWYNESRMTVTHAAGRGFLKVPQLARPNRQERGKRAAAQKEGYA